MSSNNSGFTLGSESAPPRLSCLVMEKSSLFSAEPGVSNSVPGVYSAAGAGAGGLHGEDAGYGKALGQHSHGVGQQAGTHGAGLGPACGLGTGGGSRHQDRGDHRVPGASHGGHHERRQDRSSLNMMLKDPFWVNRVKNLGKGRRLTANYEYDGKSFKTRADTGGKKNLLEYANKDVRPLKRDWICVCEASNFERNYECRNCRRSKEEGLREEDDANMIKKKTGKAK